MFHIQIGTGEKKSKQHNNIYFHFKLTLKHFEIVKPDFILFF